MALRLHMLWIPAEAGKITTSPEPQVERCLLVERVRVEHGAKPATFSVFTQKTKAGIRTWCALLVTIGSLGLHPAPAKSDPSAPETLSADALAVNGCVYNRPIGQGVVALYCNGLFCGQLIGHEIKSRAQVTMITNNRLYDGAANSAQGCNAGSSSLAIDVANGGTAMISSNQIVQGSTTQNYKLVDYGEEGLWYSSKGLLVSGNNFTSVGTPNPTAVYDPNCVPVQLTNNGYTGITTIVDPPACALYQ